MNHKGDIFIFTGCLMFKEEQVFLLVILNIHNFMVGYSTNCLIVKSVGELSNAELLQRMGYSLNKPPHCYMLVLLIISFLKSS